MPSGAKKRKAAKKKLQKEAHKNNGSHSHSQGSDDPKFHDEREINHEDEGGKEVNLGDGYVAEAKSEGSDDVTVHTDDVAREFRNGSNKSSTSSSSSSSSSSDEEEVVVETEKPAEAESGKVEQLDETTTAFSGDVLMPAENVEASVDESVEESIPTEESVKQVVSLPQESTVISESVPVESSLASNVIESGLKKLNVYEVLQPFDDKTKIGSGVIELLQEKIEEKAISVVHGGSESTSEPVGVAARDDEVLLPQSSDVKAVEECGLDGNSKAPETHKYTEEQPLLSSAPVPVRRTSWMNCCGLFEVFSGGSS